MKSTLSGNRQQRFRLVAGLFLFSAGLLAILYLMSQTALYFPEHLPPEAMKRIAISADKRTLHLGPYRAIDLASGKLYWSRDEVMRFDHILRIKDDDYVGLNIRKDHASSRRHDEALAVGFNRRSSHRNWTRAVSMFGALHVIDGEVVWVDRKKLNVVRITASETKIWEADLSAMNIAQPEEVYPIDLTHWLVHRKDFEPGNLKRGRVELYEIADETAVPITSWDIANLPQCSFIMDDDAIVTLSSDKLALERRSLKGELISRLPTPEPIASEDSRTRFVDSGLLECNSFRRGTSLYFELKKMTCINKPFPSVSLIGRNRRDQYAVFSELYSREAIFVDESQGSEPKRLKLEGDKVPYFGDSGFLVESREFQPLWHKVTELPSGSSKVYAFDHLPTFLFSITLLAGIAWCVSWQVFSIRTRVPSDIDFVLYSILFLAVVGMGGDWKERGLDSSMNYACFVFVSAWAAISSCHLAFGNQNVVSRIGWWGVGVFIPLFGVLRVSENRLFDFELIGGYFAEVIGFVVAMVFMKLIRSTVLLNDQSKSSRRRIGIGDFLILMAAAASGTCVFREVMPILKFVHQDMVAIEFAVWCLAGYFLSLVLFICLKSNYRDLNLSDLCIVIATTAVILIGILLERMGRLDILEIFVGYKIESILRWVVPILLLAFFLLLNLRLHGWRISKVNIPASACNFSN